ncbi:MAG: hypothetical protein PHT34_07770 [Oscillospiraceae bacterium]|nr:hypothetical protein [Oscillospiraceae bacterium]
MKNTAELYRRVRHLVDAGHKAVVITMLRTGEITKTELSEHEIKNLCERDAVTGRIALTALETGKLQVFDDEDGAISIAEAYCPESKLIVLGGGHIALPLVEFA